MGDTIKVNTMRLKTDADFIGGHIQKIETEIKGLRDDVRQLDAMWDGPSSETFKASFRDDIDMLESIIKNMRKINQYENSAQSSYNTCERKVAELVGSIRI